ncbi:MAG: hypothetical protein MUF49_18690 [Oculatellaceae cyanobacterium Prado106]|jgi:Ca2+-binding RTX toxin-like protein|nr:hypothetical protein [Oculatellaceae cyanobacterium Prado106]
MGMTKRGSFTYFGREPITGIGSNSNDRQTSGYGNDILYGNGGFDYLSSGLGDDTLYGGTGSDELRGGGDYDDLYGEQGIDYLFGEEGLDELYGGDDTDYLYGGTDADTLGGGYGDDYLYGESGNDWMHGHDGTDFMDGGDNDDTLYGGYGNDTLMGGNGNDYLYGRGYAEEFDFYGYDTALYTQQYANYRLSFTDWGDVQVSSNEGTDILRSIDQLNFANGGVVKIYNGSDHYGDAIAADPIYAALMDGGSGNDTLTGGNGSDTLSGGTSYDNGSDVLNGGSGSDIAAYYNVFTHYAASFTSDGAVQLSSTEGTDLLRNIERITFSNGGFYNVYNGDGSNNRLVADPNVWSLLYGGNSHDTLYGGRYNDTLAGGNANDILLGGDGNDVLTGGNGNDTLTGGNGSDQFKFGGAGEVLFNGTNIDTLTDFVVGTDKILLRQGDFAALLSPVGGNLAATEFASVLSDAAAGVSSAKIVYNSVTGNLFYNADGAAAGFGGGGQFATLTGSPDTLSGSDFVVTAA